MQACTKTEQLAESTERERGGGGGGGMEKNFSRGSTATSALVYYVYVNTLSLNEPASGMEG